MALYVLEHLLIRSFISFTLISGSPAYVVNPNM